MLSSWPSFLIATALVSLSPGANALAVVQSALQQGFSPTLRVIAGQQLSLATQMAFVAFGLAYLSEPVLQSVRVAGAAYLLWVGLGLLRTKQEGPTEPGGDEVATPGFWRGYLVNGTNPKALVFQASFVPQFLSVGEPLFGQYMVLGGIMLTIELAVMVSYAGLAARARQWMSRASVRRTIERLCGSIFVGLALLMAASR